MHEAKQFKATTHASSTAKATPKPLEAAAIPPRLLPPLIATLYRVAAQREQAISEMAECLGVTHGYLAQLQTGIRSTERISREFAEAAGRYLGIPTVLVLVMAGCIKAEDFIFPSLVQSIDSELAGQCLETGLGALMPESVTLADIEIKSYLILLFQEARLTLLQDQRRLPLALEELMRATLIFDNCASKQR